MLRRYVWIKNLLFLTLFSYLTAQIGNQLVLSHIPEETVQEQHSRPAGPAQDPGKPRTLKSYELIAGRNIFNSDHTGSGLSDGLNLPKSTAPLKRTELSVKLIGTVVSTPDTSFAIIEDQKTSKQELFRIDDMIQESARVLEINRCRVVVLREGAQEILECPDEEQRRARGGPAAAAAGPQVPPSGGDSNTIKKVSESEYLIDESEVQSSLDNINELITQVRVVPNFQDGRANGFKVFAIKPNSVFSKIGLKNGDVIQKINERDITTPDRAFQAFQDLRNERSLTVEILRRGGQQTLRYEIR